MPPVPDPILYALALVGAVGVGVVFLALAVILGTVTLVGIERLFVWLSGVAFRAGGGRTHEHPDGERHPRAPYDRLWIELSWLAGVMRWIQDRFGVANYRSNPAERPDIERLHELRNERGETE